MRVFTCFSALEALLGALGTLLGALGTLLGRSWDALGCSWEVLGRSWTALGALLSALGTLLGKNMQKKPKKLAFLRPNLEPQIHTSWLKNPLKIDVKKTLVLKRFFYFFCIFRELLAKARPLNFVAPVDVLRGFSKVGVSH